MGYIFPTDLPVSSPYGPRSGGFHYGIDFSDGVAGHLIGAVDGGTVVYKAFEPGGFGNTVTILHPDGLKSGYGHLRDPAVVNVGDVVVQGQLIGIVGSTGASTGPHLHLWMGDGPNPPGVIDPTPLLGNPQPAPEDDMTPQEHDWLLALWEAYVNQKVQGTVATINRTGAGVDQLLRTPPGSASLTAADITKIATEVADLLSVRLAG